MRYRRKQTGQCEPSFQARRVHGFQQMAAFLPGRGEVSYFGEETFHAQYELVQGQKDIYRKRQPRPEEIEVMVAWGEWIAKDSAGAVCVVPRAQRENWEPAPMQVVTAPIEVSPAHGRVPVVSMIVNEYDRGTGYRALRQKLILEDGTVFYRDL